MVQLVVCSVDKVNSGNFYSNTHCPKRGDIIEAFSDDFDLTQFPKVVNNPNWIIIQVADADIQTIASFLAPEREAVPISELDPRNASQTLQFRATRIDLDGLGLDEEAISQYKTDPMVIRPIPKPRNFPGGGSVTIASGSDVTLFVADISPLLFPRPRIPDPGFIGSPVPTDPLVIG